MKIVYNKNNTLRIIDYNEKADLADIIFYIPKELNGNFYCRIIDSNNNEDILTLSYSESDKMYNIYNISLDNTIACKEGNSTLSLLYFNNSQMKSSENFSLVLTYNTFTLGSQINLIEKLSKEISGMYNKIIDLTQMNIDIYKDIKEVSEK
jgi:c-di-GMP-binding flagellar brake protein YcgR